MLSQQTTNTVNIRKGYKIKVYCIIGEMPINLSKQTYTVFSVFPSPERAL